MSIRTRSSISSMRTCRRARTTMPHAKRGDSVRRHGSSPRSRRRFHFASCQARNALERHAWDDAASIVPRQPAVVDWDRFPWPEAISQFARGLGEAHGGGLDSARAALERLGQLEEASRRTGEDVFTRNIRMLRLELSGWIAHRAGEEDSSIAQMQQAAALEV